MVLCKTKGSQGIVLGSQGEDRRAEGEGPTESGTACQAAVKHYCKQL